MPASRFTVRVTKDYLVFCSGHFITYDGDHCERIHGHNYRASVEVEDGLDGNSYVVDFIALKDMTRAIVEELDHRMLLPTLNPLVELVNEGPNIRVAYHDRYWSFPREECVLLPIANTTAELLADYIASRLDAELKTRMSRTPRVLRVEVEESFGQSARVEWRGDEADRELLRELVAGEQTPNEPSQSNLGSIGAMRDDPDLLDQAVEHAMKVREERPWRLDPVD